MYRQPEPLIGVTYDTFCHTPMILIMGTRQAPADQTDISVPLCSP